MNKDTEDKMIEILMKTALELSSLSKCSAKKVCCILYKEGSVVSIGINGTKSGEENCCDRFEKIDGLWYEYGNLCSNQEKHHEWSVLHEYHAEQNAIKKANCDLEGAYAIITHSPCNNCSKLLSLYGVTRVYYHYEYDDINLIRDYLESLNIELIKL